MHTDTGYIGANQQIGWPNLTWQIGAKQGRIELIPEGPAQHALERGKKAEASVRTKIEHLFA